jgi:hypothetical protein
MAIRKSVLNRSSIRFPEQWPDRGVKPHPKETASELGAGEVAAIAWTN